MKRTKQSDDEKLFGVGAVTGIVSVGLAQLANHAFSKFFDFQQSSALIISTGIMLMMFGVSKGIYFHQRSKKNQNTNSATV